jgi:hypothetical protein
VSNKAKSSHPTQLLTSPYATTAVDAQVVVSVKKRLIPNYGKVIRYITRNIIADADVLSHLS